MSNTNASLKNYETLIWLFEIEETDNEWRFQSKDCPNNTGCQGLIALIASRNDKILYLCYILADVLHNPCASSPDRDRKLVALNSDINRTAKPSPPRSFSSDATQELDKDQVFSLFYTYLRLRYGTSQKRLFSDATLLDNLLAGMDGEFRTYFEVSKEHKNLLWNGFKNGARNEKQTSKPRRKKTLTYADFRDKIEEYYFSVPSETPTSPVIQDNPHDYEISPHEERAIPGGGANRSLFWRYFPVFFSYLSYIGHVLFLPSEILWEIAFGVTTFIVSIIWFHFFLKTDRAWAVLLQGFWLLSYIVLPKTTNTALFSGILVCLLLVLNYLPRRYTDAPTQLKPFINKWIGILFWLGVLSVILLDAKESETRRGSLLSRETYDAIGNYVHAPNSFHSAQDCQNMSVARNNGTAGTVNIPPNIPQKDELTTILPIQSQNQNTHSRQLRPSEFPNTLRNPPKDALGLIISTIQAKMDEVIPSIKILSLKLLSEDTTAPFTYRAEITFNQALYGVSNVGTHWLDQETGDRVKVSQGRWREACLITPAGTPTPYKVKWISPSQWHIEPLQKAKNYAFENRLADEYANEAIFVEESEAITELHNLLNKALDLVKQIKKDRQRSTWNAIVRESIRENTRRLDTFSRELGTFLRINRGKIVRQVPSHLLEILQGRRKCPSKCPFWESYVQEEIVQLDTEFKSESNYRKSD